MLVKQSLLRVLPWSRGVITAQSFQTVRSSSNKSPEPDTDSDGPRIEEDAVRTLGIVGAGQIGTGVLLQTLAVTSKQIVLTDLDQMALTRCQGFVEKHLERQVQEGRMTENRKKKLLSRLSLSSSLEHMKTADFVLEAVCESETLKTEVLSNVFSIVPSTTTLATHTACLSVSRLASLSKTQNRLVGMRFLHPVQVMRLVEVVGGVDTPPQAINTALRFAGALGKYAIQSQDEAGFITLRILMPLVNEAAHALHHGVASATDIDTAMKLGAGMSRGPLELADYLGLDVCLTAMRVMQADLASERFQPCPLLVKLVNGGKLGRKTGQGFHKYDIE